MGRKINIVHLPVELVVQVAEPDEDQPLELPAWTYRVTVVPDERPLRTLDRLVCSVQVEPL